MPHALKLHPGSRCDVVTRIEVEVASAGRYQLTLHYVVWGNVAGLRLPPITASTRTDELWRHTCFEAFVHAQESSAYYEFNFAPSTQWAAYSFSAPRTGMAPLNEIDPPQIGPQIHPERYELKVSLALDRLKLGSHLALSAVIEETSGAKSYWALAHPPGGPDFHHPVGFALELP